MDTNTEKTLRKSKKLKMWQIILISLGIAVVLTLGYLAYESIALVTTGLPPIHREQWGGECRIETGLFWSVTILEPMTSIDDPVAPSPDIRNFRAAMLLVSVLTIFAAAWIILSLINGKWKTVLIAVGAVVIGALLFWGGKKIQKKINETPEKLIKIEIYTTDIRPGQCFAVEYPRNAYYLVKAGEEGKFGRTETRKLENSVSTDDVSKAELNEIIAAVRKVDENSNNNYKEDVAYFVSVHYAQKKGYGTVGAYGYGGYPEGWDELVALTNDLCGGDYLSETPTVQTLTEEWFSETFGIYEEDLPDGVTVDHFMKSQRIDMNFLSGYRNHYPFDAKKHYESFMDYYQ